MKNYLTEFIGTLFLVMTIGLAVGAGTILAPIAIGAALMVMVYMGAHISGAHYNPAVTLAMLVRGKIDIKEGALYWLSQILGGVVGAVLVKVLVQDESFLFSVEPPNSASVVQALLVEILFTFAWALVYLNVMTAKATARNSYYGLAIGFTLMAGVFAGGPISYGAFNPATGIGPNLISQTFLPIWIYVVGPLIGGALAGLVFKTQNPEG
jgi:aquaporin Z